MKKYKFLLIIASLVFKFSVIANINPSKLLLDNKNQYLFSENKGQVFDQNLNHRNDVLIIGKTNDYSFFFRSNGISYQFMKQLEKSNNKILIQRVDVNWLNCNKNVTLSKYGKSTESFNYYNDVSPNGIKGVFNYEKIKYNNLYNDIDMVWYNINNQLKYDFIVKPYADLSQIKLEINGAEKISINKEGQLIVKTTHGTLIEDQPIVMQEGKKLNAAWSIVGKNIVSYLIQGRDISKELIIDPVVRAWGTYYGDNLFQLSQSVITDSNNNVYISGRSDNSSLGIIATSGAFQTIFGGGSSDLFIVKFDSNGNRLWGTYCGGAANEQDNKMCISSTNEIYIVGTVNAAGSAIATPGSHQSTYSGSTDGFLMKFDSNGIKIWGTYYGGPDFDNTKTCAVDNSGDVYIGGATSSTLSSAISSSGSHQVNFSGNLDGFIAKFSSSGVRLWGTYYGGVNNEWVHSLSTDNLGNLFACGETTSWAFNSQIATPGSHQQVYTSSVCDAFLVKFNSSGIRQWGTFYGGIGEDIAYDCDVDGSGNVYMVGMTSTNTNTFIASPGYQGTHGGGTYDAFFCKFSNSGVRQWGSYYGGNQSDDAFDCEVDISGNLYFVGNTNTTAPGVFATAGSHQILASSAPDSYIVKFTTNCTRVWGSYYGGTGADVSRGIALSSNGDLYITGNTNSINTNAISTSTSHQPLAGGGQDSFLAKFFECNNPSAPPSTTPLINQSICSGKTGTLSVSSTPTVNWYSAPSGGSLIYIGNPYIVPSNSSPGNYTLYASTNSTCGVSLIRTPITFTVNVTPTVNASVIGSNTICQGSTVIVNATGANSYTWNSSVVGNFAQFTPASSTGFSVVGTNTLGGCTASSVVQVTVYTTPTISVNSGSICQGKSFTITPSGATTYTIAGGNFIVNPLSNTTYTVNGSNTNGCISVNTVTSTVTVNNLPFFSIYNLENVSSICSGATTSLYVVSGTISPAVSYTWNNGSTNPTITISPTVSTNYSVTATAANGCTNTSTYLQNVQICTNIESWLTDEKFKIDVYPNPSNNLFNIVIYNKQSKNLVKVIDLFGKVLLSNSITADKFQLDLNNYSNGIYILEVISGDKREIIRLIKN